MDELEKIEIPQHTISPEYLKCAYKNPGKFNKYENMLKGHFIQIKNMLKGIVKTKHNLP